MKFKISATTDVGIKRKVNQDSLFVRKLGTRTGEMVFAVLCDGMGGLQYGERASAALLSAFTDWMYSELPLLSQKPLEDCVVRSQWEAVVAAQNSRIREFGFQNGCTVGTTVTALLLTQTRYYLLNIGDSRAYEMAGEVRQLTVDHTVVEEEVLKGNLTAEQAAASPMKNVLTRCVGAVKTALPDMFFGQPKAGALYMLCSDGFRHFITKEEMLESLMGAAAKGMSLKRQEEYLIELNKRRGETDNISVITIYAEP